MTATVLRWVNDDFGGGTSKVVDISAIAVGESMIVLHLLGSTTPTVDPPAGWDILFAKVNVGSRAALAFHRKKVDEAEVSVTFTASVSMGGWAHALLGVLGSDAVEWIVGPFWTRSLHGTSSTNVVDGVTTLGANSVAAVFSFENTSSMEIPNSILGVDNGFVELGYHGQFAEGDRLETIWAGTKAIAVPGDVGDTTVSYRNTHSSNGGGIMVAFPEGSYIPLGLPITTSEGPARLSVIDSLNTRVGVKSIKSIKPGFSTVAQLMSTPGATIAHRCGSNEFPEMSEYAADQTILNGFGALEFSANRTSDGWWFGEHDQTMDRVTGLTGLPPVSTMTRAEVEAYANVLNPTEEHPSRPFYGLEEFLDKFGKNYVLMLDPKFSFGFNTEFMTICEGIVDPTRLIWKYSTLGTPGDNSVSNAALAAMNRGWGGTFGGVGLGDVDSGSFSDHSGKAGWTSFGATWNGPQAYWDAILAAGKPVVGNLPSTQEAYDTAMNLGAAVVKCSSVLAIQPVSV